MKKMLSLLLVFTLVLSMATSAFAAEGTDCGEQPQDQEDQTAPTVSTLEELQAAIAAAKDGDTIAISEEITLDCNIGNKQAHCHHKIRYISFRYSYPPL